MDFTSHMPEQVYLERLRVGVSTAVGPQVAAEMTLEQMRDLVFDRMVYKLEASLLAEKLGSHTETATKAVPLSWWDHWKVEHSRTVRWWSRWVWRLEPDRKRMLELTATWTDWATFPHNTYMVPSDALGRVVFQRQGSNSGVRDAF